jgi:hypothetical protein
MIIENYRRIREGSGEVAPGTGKHRERERRNERTQGFSAFL